MEKEHEWMLYNSRWEGMREDVGEQLGEEMETKRQQTANDYQVGGSHYTNITIQPWDAMKAWMSAEEFQGFLRGNVVKYISRMNRKGGLEDAMKAKHYLEKLIEEMEKGKDGDSNV